MAHLEQQLDEIIALESQIHEGRRTVRERFEDVRKARAVVALRVHEWATDGQAPLTFEQNIRDELARSQAHRAARAAGLVPPRQRRSAQSYIDRVGSYAFQGDGSDFARSRMQRGFRRGSLTKTQAAHANAQRARLPSEK